MTGPTWAGRLALRPVAPDDELFLLGLFASTRRAELAVLPLDDAQIDALVAQQFAAQSAAYRAYPDHDHRIVELDGCPIGRLYRAPVDGTLRIVDIALVPERRAQGIGTELLREVLAAADDEGRVVTLHLERWNPARSLYDRLGFVPAGGDDVYLLLERPPRRDGSDDGGEVTGGGSPATPRGR